MLKTVFQEVWEEEPDVLEKSCSRFRADTNLNQYLIRYWQFATNRFYPFKRNGFSYEHYNEATIADLQNVLLEERYNSICINDNFYCSEKDYQLLSKTLRDSFEKKFPTISMFEKSD